MVDVIPGSIFAAILVIAYVLYSWRILGELERARITGILLGRIAPTTTEPYKAPEKRGRYIDTCFSWTFLPRKRASMQAFRENTLWGYRQKWGKNALKPGFRRFRRKVMTMRFRPM